MGMLKLALDGTKIHANASRHSALSYEHAGRIEARLQAEVAEALQAYSRPQPVRLYDGLLGPGYDAEENVIA